MVYLIREWYIVYQISKQRKEYMRCHEIDNIPIPQVFYCGIKRTIDVLIAALVCLTVLPILYIILGIVIKLTSPGPIIFKQKRVGIFGKVFTCYKFRSMYINADDKIVIKAEDIRVTSIGRFIRKTHIDEIPQFFNVLKGDMSLVGPRPQPEKVVASMDNKIGVYMRQLVNPGITGLTQVNSGRFLSEEQNMQYDMAYVSKLSLLKDIGLIWQTLKFNDKTC